jgi:thiaminase (transcriptional activator TenA)
LARAAFAYYVGQDAAFLDVFCRAYALALAKSPDQDGLIAFWELLDAAADELPLHQGYAARWDVDLHQAADPATAAYTNFLLAGGALEPGGHIAADALVSRHTPEAHLAPILRSAHPPLTD